MKAILTSILLVALSILARAGTDVPAVAGSLDEFAQAFGLPEGTAISELKVYLQTKWVGATRDDMRVYLNTIIHARGSLGATKNGEQSFLAVSSPTRSLVIDATYDTSGKVTDVKCSIKIKKKKEPNQTSEPTAPSGRGSS